MILTSYLIKQGENNKTLKGVRAKRLIATIWKTNKIITANLIEKVSIQCGWDAYFLRIQVI